jgi:hypothetical protein
MFGYKNLRESNLDMCCAFITRYSKIKDKQKKKIKTTSPPFATFDRSTTLLSKPAS